MKKLLTSLLLLLSFYGKAQTKKDTLIDNCPLHPSIIGQGRITSTISHARKDSSFMNLKAYQIDAGNHNICIGHNAGWGMICNDYCLIIGDNFKDSVITGDSVTLIDTTWGYFKTNNGREILEYIRHTSSLPRPLFIEGVSAMFTKYNKDIASWYRQQDVCNN